MALTPQQGEPLGPCRIFCAAFLWMGGVVVCLSLNIVSFCLPCFFAVPFAFRAAIVFLPISIALLHSFCRGKKSAPIIPAYQVHDATLRKRPQYAVWQGCRGFLHQHFVGTGEQGKTGCFVHTGTRLPHPRAWLVCCAAALHARACAHRVFKYGWAYDWADGAACLTADKMDDNIKHSAMELKTAAAPVRGCHKRAEPPILDFDAMAYIPK